MGEITAKSKMLGDAVLRRRRPTVAAAFRRDRRTSDELCVPTWGRIVFRNGRSTTLR